jgi:hypothetical protein
MCAWDVSENSNFGVFCSENRRVYSAPGGKRLRCSVTGGSGDVMRTIKHSGGARGKCECVCLGCV